MDFNEAFKWILEVEGGYVNDPNDPGGETKYGISKRSHPTVNIKSLTLDEAAKIYKEKYWDACKCDRLRPDVAFLVFDIAVNQGAGAAIKLLQEAVGVEADGIVGPRTIAAANYTPLNSLLVDLTALRCLRYAKTPNFTLYGKGWFRRAIGALQRLK